MAHHGDEGCATLHISGFFRFDFFARYESPLLHFRLIGLVECASDRLGHLRIFHAGTSLLQQLVVAFVLMVSHLLNLGQPRTHHAAARAQQVSVAALW